MISRITGRRIYVLGLGQSGQASMRWCLEQGACVYAGDTRDASLLESIKKDFPNVPLYCGSEALHSDCFKDIDYVVVSPGLSPYHIELVKLKEAYPHIVWIGELELFAWALEEEKAVNGYSPKLVAVTGTNGKTTVVSMLYDMFRVEGYHVCVAGNISPSVLEALLSFKNKEYPDVWVIELSSFQLYRTEHLRVDCACILNITPDHLDWHQSMEDYVSSKLKLLNFSPIVWVDREDDYLKSYIDFEFTDVRSFGLNSPCRMGDLGVVHQGIDWFSWIRLNHEVQSCLSLSIEEPSECIMPVQELSVKGGHNIKNAMAAMGVGYSLGLHWGNMMKALMQYQAQPHRCIFVRSIRGVDFVDDSKGTNVGATIAALKGFQRSCAIILGGLSKGQEFNDLIPLINEYVHTILLIGQDADLLNNLFSKNCSTVKIKLCSSLEEATQEGFKASGEGGMVLLSPACASMDMFRDYHHRGEVFVDAVNELAQSLGDVV